MTIGLVRIFSRTQVCSLSIPVIFGCDFLIRHCHALDFLSSVSSIALKVLKNPEVTTCKDHSKTPAHDYH